MVLIRAVNTGAPVESASGAQAERVTDSGHSVAVSQARETGAGRGSQSAVP